MNAGTSVSIIYRSRRRVAPVAKEKQKIEEEGAGEEDELRSLSLRNCHSLADAKRLHSLIASHNPSQDQEPYLHNLVVQMYGRCGSTRDAIAAFDNIRAKNIFSWNIVIGACLRNGDAIAALQLFWRMECDGSVRPSTITFLCVVRACSILPPTARILRLLDEIHARCSSDVAVMNSLLTIYGRWARLRDALAIFRILGKKRDAISWTSMIAAFAQHGDPLAALHLFREMDPALLDKTTLISALGACSNLGGSQGLAHGAKIHALISSRGYESDAMASNALIHFYGKCGSAGDAKIVFDRMPSATRSVVSWNSLIQAYSLAGDIDQALHLYGAMDLAKNDVTFATALGACYTLADGQAIHAHVNHRQRQCEPLTGTALAQMYGRVGSLRHALEAFRGIRTKTTVTWNTLLTAYSNRGYATLVDALFREMSLEGVEVNGVSFVSLLHGSNKSLDASFCYFREMRGEYGIFPSAEHYGCLIDVLGRAGELDQAQDLIESMPFHEDVVAWMSLLCACAMHGEFKRAFDAAEKASSLEESDSAPYTILSNMFIYLS